MEDIDHLHQADLSAILRSLTRPAFPFARVGLFKQMLEEESHDDQSSQHRSGNNQAGGFIRIDFLLQIGFG